MVWTAAPDGGDVRLNRHGRELADLSEGTEPGRRFVGVLHPDDVEGVNGRWDEARRTASAWQAACRLRTPAGDVDVLLRAEPVFDADGGLAGWSGTWSVPDAGTPAGRHLAGLRDELARQQRRAELFRQFHASLARMAEESLRSDLDAAHYARVLRCAVRLVPGVCAGSLIRRRADGSWTHLAVAGRGRRLRDEAAPPDGARDQDDASDPHVVRGAPEGGRARLAAPVRFGGRLEAYLYLDAADEGDAFDADAFELARLFARQLGSVMQRQELQHELRHQAYTDVVTGIPNRRRAEELLQDRLDASLSGVLLFVDLDDFKHVNEAHGHAVGDALLREVAVRLTHFLDDDAVLARWGGDEFLVVLPDPGGADRATAVALEIEAALRPPFLVAGHAVSTSGSVGIALIDDATVSVQQAVLEADIALNRAKRLGKRRAVLFSPELGAETSRRFAIERALRDALRGGDELRVQYQARVDSTSCRTVGVEALSRWTHPTLGELSPSEFVPIAEAAGLIDDLTRRVLAHATKQAREWLDAGTPRLVSVNLSAACIRRPSIVDDVREALEAHRLPASLLELEVTETAAMSGMQEAIENLEALRDLGVSLSIDDFGTAYSSLTYLRLLPVDTIKVDRTFVRHIADDIADSPTESSIVKGIVALARSLGMRVVAEGVETEAQADFLRRLGCDGMQGFYFGRAKPADAFA